MLATGPGNGDIAKKAAVIPATISAIVFGIFWVICFKYNKIKLQKGPIVKNLYCFKIVWIELSDYAAFCSRRAIRCS